MSRPRPLGALTLSLMLAGCAPQLDAEPSGSLTLDAPALPDSAAGGSLGDARPSDAADGQPGLQLDEPVLDPSSGDPRVAVLLNQGDGPEVVVVDDSGVISITPLPPEVTYASELFADGDRLYVMGSGYRIVDVETGDSFDLPVYPFNGLTVSAPGEVTVPDEYDLTVVDLESGDVLSSRYDSDTCWMGVGRTADGGAVVLDVFSSQVRRLEGDLVGAVVGSTSSWSARLALDRDGVLWTADTATLSRSDGRQWTLSGPINGLAPFGDSIAVLVDTWSGEQPARLSRFDDGVERVLAEFPGAVVFDVEPMLPR